MLFTSTQNKAGQGECLRPEDKFRAGSLFPPLLSSCPFYIFLYRNLPLFLTQSFQHELRLDVNSLASVSTTCPTTPRFHMTSWTPLPCFPPVELRYGERSRGWRTEVRVLTSHPWPLSHCTAVDFGKCPCFIVPHGCSSSSSLGLSLGVGNCILSLPIQVSIGAASSSPVLLALLISLLICHSVTVQ